LEQNGCSGLTAAQCDITANQLTCNSN